MSIFGYFTKVGQVVPDYDPGLQVNCPHCGKQLAEPIRTISLRLLNGGRRSYFYRVHRDCDELATPDAVQEIESRVIDSDAREWNN